MIQRFCRLIVVVAGVGVLHAEEGKIPITTSSPEAREQFLAGQVLVDNLRLTDAIPRFQKAVQLDPGFALAQLYLAQTAPTPKEFFAHLKEADELSAKASEGERLWIKGARAGAYADLEGQLKVYKELAQNFPRDERAQTLLGIAYFAQQNYGAAAEKLKHATEISPAFAPAYNQLGYAYRFLDRYADAEQVFRKYTELIPNDPNPYDSYAELLLKMGKFDESIVQYRKALEINRYFTNSYAGIAAAFAYQGRHQQAREALATALDLARTDGERRAALFSLTVIDLDESKTQSALAQVQKQYDLGERTNDVAAMAGDVILRGNILLEEGNAGNAMKEFAQAAKMIKQSDLAAEVRGNAGLIYHYNAGRAAVGMHDLAAAAQEASAFRKGVEAKKNVNQIRLMHELDGLIAMESGEYQKAVDCLLQSNLQNPYNLYRVAIAYQALGDTTKARDYSRRAALFNVLPLPNYAFVRMKARKMMDTL
jgi:tetratricopeptide (TPR) repeat protein